MHLLQCIDALFKLNVIWRKLGLYDDLLALGFAESLEKLGYLVIHLTELLLKILLGSPCKGRDRGTGMNQSVRESFDYRCPSRVFTLCSSQTPGTYPYCRPRLLVARCAALSLVVRKLVDKWVTI